MVGSVGMGYFISEELADGSRGGVVFLFYSFCCWIDRWNLNGFGSLCGSVVV